MAQKQELKQNWMKGYDVVIGEDVETAITTDFSEMLHSAISKNFEEGEVFMGTIISIGQDYVTVDIG